MGKIIAIKIAPEQRSLIGRFPELSAILLDCTKFQECKSPKTENVYLYATEGAIEQALEYLEDWIVREGFDEEYLLSETGAQVDRLMAVLTKAIVSQ